MCLQTTQPTSGGAVTSVLENCCAYYADTSSPQKWGPKYLALLFRKPGDKFTKTVLDL